MFINVVEVHVYQTVKIDGSRIVTSFRGKMNIIISISYQVLSINYLAMPALVRTPSGASCKGVLQLQATFIDVKNMLEDILASGFRRSPNLG